MLPRDGDTTVYLGVQVGTQIGRRRSERGGDRRRVGELVAAGGRCPGCVPDRARGELGGDSHVGAMVLDRLIHRDRTTELDALLRVGRSHLGALTCDTDGIGRQDHPGEIDEQATPSSDHRDRRIGQRHAGASTARVEADRRVDRDAGADLDDRDVVSDGDEDQVGQAHSEHDPDVTRCRCARDGHRPAERHSTHRRPVGESRQQARPEVVVGSCCNDGAGDDGRHERTGSDGASELLDHDDELVDPIAGPTDIFGKVEAQPTEFGELGPELRERVVGRVEQVAGGATQVALHGEAAHRLGERTVVVGDGDRHGERTSAGRRWDADIFPDSAARGRFRPTRSTRSSRPQPAGA